MSFGKVGWRETFWLVIIYVVFVTSSVLLALSDRIAVGGSGKSASASASNRESTTSIAPAASTQYQRRPSPPHMKTVR